MPKLTDALRREYEELWQTCVIRPECMAEIRAAANKIVEFKAQYLEATALTKVPFAIIGVIDTLEAGGGCCKHLHNGDSLARPTVNVPKGRPSGKGPFPWLVSAVDALTYDGLDRWTDWSIAGSLHRLELYNGWGYRKLKAPIPSPYLWSMSSHYSKGKFTSDGKYSATAVSKQCGAATILKQLELMGAIKFEVPVVPAQVEAPATIVFGERSQHVRLVQMWLNAQFGAKLVADGIAGKQTSAAMFKHCGEYLLGDPRA